MFRHQDVKEAVHGLNRMKAIVDDLEGLLQRHIASNEGKTTESTETRRRLITELKNIHACCEGMLKEHAQMASAILGYYQTIQKHCLKKDGAWRTELLTESAEILNEETSTFQNIYQQLFTNYIQHDK